ncbi:MAG: S8 family serine peptidase [Candidatus Eisenbacteria bacterium]
MRPVSRWNMKSLRAGVPSLPRGFVGPVGLVCLASAVASPVLGQATDPFAAEPGEFLIELASPSELEEFVQRWNATVLGESESVYRVFIAGDEEEILEALETDESVLDASPNHRQHTPEAVRQMVLGAMGGTYSQYAEQNVADQIGLPLAHEAGRGAGVIVAVLDTGIDPLHELFRSDVAAGWDFVDSDPLPWEERHGFDEDDDGAVDEGFGHGTMVAGLVRLVAPEATLLPVRILDDEGRGDAFRVVQGIRWAVEHGADVINLSLGAPYTISIVRKAVQEAVGQGVLVVASAGNEGQPGPAYCPADVPEALMVTAVDAMDAKAAFADYHPKVVVSAPGVGLRSAFPFGQWSIGDGCSFATALVSGAAAVIESVYPGIEPTFLAAVIEASVHPIDHLPANEPFVGRLGSGRLFLPLGLGDTTSAPSPGSLGIRPALLVTPNPATGSVGITLEGMVSARFARLEALDASGRIVYVDADFDGNADWNLSADDGASLPAGTYFLRVLDGSSVLAEGRVVRVR